MATVGSKVESMGGDKKSKRSIWESLASSTPKGMSLMDFFVPILVIILVVAIGAFLYPYVETIFESRNKIQNLKTENAFLSEKWEKMQSLNPTVQSQIITDLEKLIPNSLEISELALYVRGVANNYSLEPISLTLENSEGLPTIENVNDVSGMEGFQAPENMYVIFGPFSYRGRVESIAGFLDDITGKGILISVSDFSISKERTVVEVTEGADTTQEEPLDWYFNSEIYQENLWNISFVLVGYTIDGEVTFDEMSALPVVDTETINEEIQARVR